MPCVVPPAAGKVSFRQTEIWILWTGLFSDSWQWSDQSDPSFRNWNAFDPTNQNGIENCAAIYYSQGQWSDTPCFGNGNEQHHVDLVMVDSIEMRCHVGNVVKQTSTESVWLGLHNFCSMNIWI
ncbi:hypothetical protein DNTS_012055 [Danionella cerebrum]|uniref:C-type lectin domain-containing protein n=1 Tax=Danionella cerebrum TaxID=2873325 RepID=A0A553MXB1_9TELE|nr:hypothetical protein DNTS_012055 [Danionella translucida]